ncbi:MAG: PTS glucose transporter subunit IIA [Acetatifactor sp.]
MFFLHGFKLFGRKRNQVFGGQSGSIGSPVKGQIEESRDGGQPMAVIYPEEERIYAPTAGKVTRIYPLGNAFLFQTDAGVELYIQVGNSEDELLGRYYRPRVLQNEIVCEHKLLLEFDRAGLAKEGIYPRVTVRVLNSICDKTILPVSEGQQIAMGEDIFKIYQYSGKLQMDLVSD